MAEWVDVERVVSELPEVAEGTTFGNRAWKVRGKLFAWDRPLSKRDREAVGDVPDEPILAIRVPDEGAKQALVSAGGPSFTIPHFDGYLAVLIWLQRISRQELEEVIAEAWLDRAKVAAAYRESTG